MSAHLQTAVPVLASLDLGETLAFYTDRLGFDIRGRFDDYAMLSRDGIELHFWRCQDRHIAENTSCYLRVAGIQALHEELTRRGLDIAAPLLQPWGMREFFVIDPHGNLLKFGEPG